MKRFEIILLKIYIESSREMKKVKILNNQDIENSKIQLKEYKEEYKL